MPNQKNTLKYKDFFFYSPRCNQNESGDVVRPALQDVQTYQAPNTLIDVYAACESHVRGLGPDPDDYAIPWNAH